MKMNKIELTKTLVNACTIEDIASVIDYNKAYSLVKGLQDTVKEDTVKVKEDTVKASKKASKKASTNKVKEDTVKVDSLEVACSWFTPIDSFNNEVWEKLKKWILENQASFHKGNKVRLNSNNTIIPTNSVKAFKMDVVTDKGKRTCKGLYNVLYGHISLYDFMSTRLSKN